MVAVGATGLLILLFGGSAAGEGDLGPAAAAPTAVVSEAAQDPESGAPGSAPEDPAAPAASESAMVDDTSGVDTVAGDPAEAAREATGTLRDLTITFYNALPAIGIALALLLVAGILAKLVRMALRVVLSNWERAEATSALAAIAIWLLALGAALSVLAGDARALVGSIGLFGLALSWALQTPIESFTGWLLNSFRSYYRVGDRIGVGEVFGDVARIDFLTTTVFEAGGPEKNVQAAQSTGALITFPNAEILRSNVVNYTRDFPYVYDELTMGFTNESDLPLAVQVMERTASEVVGDRMEPAAEAYGRLLEEAHLAWDVATEPEVYVRGRESWTDVTVRYVVPVREMRGWSSRLQLALNQAFAEPKVAARVHTAYPRTQVQQVRPDRPGNADGIHRHEE